jgi:hypothetical protein
MSAEYNQSARRARALIEEISAENFGHDTSAKNTWFYEAAQQVEKIVQELFKTVADQEQAVQVQGALEHKTTTEYMQGTLTTLAEDEGTHTCVQYYSQPNLHMCQINDYGDMENASRAKEKALSKLTDTGIVGHSERDASVRNEFRTNTIGDIKSGTND